MTPRVSIDPDLCIGSAECVRIVPGGFAIDEHTGVSVPQPAVAAADAALLQEAEFSCPTGALRLVTAAVEEEHA